MSSVIIIIMIMTHIYFVFLGICLSNARKTLNKGHCLILSLNRPAMREFCTELIKHATTVYIL